MTAAALGPLWAVVSARYRTLLQYRAAAFAGFATQLFWGAIKLMIFAAFFAAATEPQPMNMTQVVAYVWLGQALLGMLPWNVDPDFRAQVRDGAVAYDLLRPLDLYAYWFGRTLAFRVAAPTLRGLPMVVFAMVLLPVVGLGEWALVPPPSLAAFVGFVASVVLAAMLATAVTLLAHISLLWTISGTGHRPYSRGAGVDLLRADRAPAAVSRLVSADSRLATVPRARRRPVPDLQRQTSRRRRSWVSWR